MSLDNLTLGPVQPISEVIEPLLTPVDDIHHAPKCTVLSEFRERLPAHQEPVPHGSGEALPTWTAPEKTI